MEEKDDRGFEEGGGAGAGAFFPAWWDTWAKDGIHFHNHNNDYVPQCAG